MSRSPTQVNHLEVLHHVCQRKHWRMRLRLEGMPGELTTLDVADRDGELIGRWTLGDDTTPRLAAMALLDGLQRGGLVP